PPETSRSARPLVIVTASFSMSSSKLSSSTMSARASSASWSCAMRSTSHSIREVWGVCARALDRDAHAAARGDVVVLDEDGRREIVAMVVSAAAAHGPALDRAQARGRLARVDDARLGSGRQRVDKRAGLGGDAAQALREV